MKKLTFPKSNGVLFRNCDLTTYITWPYGSDDIVKQIYVLTIKYMKEKYRRGIKVD